MSGTRTESDSMGAMEVPADALWGASTQRAVLNFPISGYRLGRRFIGALGLTKYAAALVNEKLGKLDAARATVIKQAAREVLDGQLDEHFPLDVFQTGSGTSANMNANEVIAQRARQIAAAHGTELAIHPNDHVNVGQSSNDVIPTAMHVALVGALHGDLMPALHRLRDALQEKAAAFHDVIKIGRTHLMDATPIRLGQEFGGYASQIAHADRRIMQKIVILRELPIGGTAVGTGINTHPDFAKLVCEVINHETRESFHEARNHFEAQAAKDAVVATSGVLRTVAVSLAKIANDIRWLASGPRCGLGELRLPAIQPGSSIMPGKVNPVVCEAVIQVCAQVLGNDAATTHAALLLGNLDLHTGMPVMAHNVLESIRLLGSVCKVFVEKCIAGLEADRPRCEASIEQSLALCTSLAPLIGYDRAAALAKEAWSTGRTIREVAAASGLLTPDQLAAALDPRSMLAPHA